MVGLLGHRRATASLIGVLLVLSVLVTAPSPIAEAQAPPTIPLFQADVTDTNLVTLRWTTQGGATSGWRLVYIEGPRRYDRWHTPAGGGAPVHKPITADVAFQGQSDTPTTPKTVTFRAPTGRQTYTLSFNSPSGAVARRSIWVDVVRPPSPQLTVVDETFEAPPTPPGAPAVWMPAASSTTIDPWVPRRTTINWASVAGDTVEVVRPRETVPPATSNTITVSGTSYVVPEADLATVGDKLFTYTIRRCRTVSGPGTPTPTEKLCSEDATVKVDRRKAQFTWARLAAASGATTNVAWTGKGNLRALTSPSLVLDSDGTPNDRWVNATNSYSVVAPPAGTHRLFLYTCHLYSFTSSRCAQAKDLAPRPGNFWGTGTGAFTASVPVGAEVEVGEKLGTVAYIDDPTDANDGPKDVLATIDGRVDAFLVANGTQVGNQTPLVTLTTASSMRLVSGSVSSLTEASYTEEFVGPGGATPPMVAPVYKHSQAGLPLDLTFTGNDVWSLGEYHEGVTRIQTARPADAACVTACQPDPEVARVQTHEIPMHFDLVTTWADANPDQPWTLTPAPSHRRRTTPFAVSFGGLAVPGAVSAAAERIITDPAGTIWFTQGGDHPSKANRNHSRIVRFTPSASDDPQTPLDDRFCAYAVPENKNEVFGIAHAGGRIWFAESRGYASLTTGSAVGSFDPATIPCVDTATTGAFDYTNDVDYTDVLPASPGPGLPPGDGIPDAGFVSYCTTAFAPGCITKTPVPSAIVLGQIGVDPNPPAGKVQLWFTEQYGQAIQRMVYTPGSGAVFTRYATNTSSRHAINDARTSFGSRIVGGYPWRIEADANYVYFSEFFDSDIVRFDKNHPNMASCEISPPPVPPLEPPVAEDTPLPPAIVNPCMSEAHVPLRDPTAVMNAIQLRNGRVYFALDSGEVGYVNTASWGTGKIYNDMHNLVEASRSDVARNNYNGIAFNAAGDLAISDFARRQVIVLRRKP